MLELEFIPISAPYWTEILNLVLKGRYRCSKAIGQLMISQKIRFRSLLLFPETH
jgi:hypothetical protein